MRRPHTVRGAPRFAGVLLAAGLAFALPSAAQPQPAPAPITGPAEANLLQALGARDGITLLVDDFVNRLVGDARVGHFFKDVKPKHLKQQISDQICQLLGGGCVYDGETMKASHADMKVTRPDFLVVVALLQDSMDARGIPFAVQNQLLARLAPMHRDIVTR